MTTPLASRLARQIRMTGPIGVAEYMQACLFDPEYGYYRGQEPFGREGDFVTAPEISQMFGELIAIWAAHAWQKLGMPAPLAFAEIGPGRGTLMRDMLRTLRSVAPEFLRAARVHMIEISGRLSEIQKRTLSTDAERVTWIGKIDDLPELPLVVVGNEIFDAIPIRQYVLSSSTWHERMIGIDEEGRLRFQLGPGSPDLSLLPPVAPAAGDGSVFETAPAREALAAAIAMRLSAHGGAALFFDYGHLRSGIGDTLQAVRRHGFVDVLACPGEADLTSHVDFSALAKACRANGANASFLEQGEFLARMGLFERAARLSAGRDEGTAHAIRMDADRLASADQMGSLFKAMAVYRGDRPPYPFDNVNSGLSAP